MTPPTPVPVISSPVTADMILYGEHSATEILARLQEQGALAGAERAGRAVSDMALKAVRTKVGEEVAGFLRQDVGSVILGGWLKYRAIKAALAASRETPDSEQSVTLDQHEIVLEQRPIVKVYLAEVKIAELRFAVTVTATVQTASLTFRNGRLTSVAAGRCDVTVSLSIDEQEVGKLTGGRGPAAQVDLGRRTAAVDLPRVLPATEGTASAAGLPRPRDAAD